MSCPVILDFCASCGIVLPEGLGLDNDPECPICDNNEKNRRCRIQGTFSEEDAKKFSDLRMTYAGE